MAEFEELRLTVNLVDNASAGLQRLRASLGGLTTSTNNMTASLNAGISGLNNLSTAVTAAGPHVRTLNEAMQEAHRSAGLVVGSIRNLTVAAQGLSGLPQIAIAVKNMALGVEGLGIAYSAIGPAASMAVTGIGAIAVAVVGLGAVVVAYGVSVFKFAGSMSDLSKAARQMGLGFAQLKYAQDQAKQFGYSADLVIQSYQGITAAQLDLYKNNSQLRATLLGQGVDAGWISQLSKLDPNQARNAIVRYGNQLEAQALASGVMRGNAARLKYQFGKEFGLSAAAMDMPELKPPSKKKAAQLEEIARYSGLISGVWRDIGHQWSLFSKELLAKGLPKLRDSMIALKGKMPEILKELKIWVKYAVSFLPGLVGAVPSMIKGIGIVLSGVVSFLREIGRTINFMMHPIDSVLKNAHPSVQRFFGREPSQESIEFWKDRYTIYDDIPTIRRGLDERLNKFRPGYKPTSFGGGTNDNNPLLQRISFTQNELKDETETNSGEVSKLTRQLERLNDYLNVGRGGGGGGFQNASFGGSAGAAAGGGYTGGGGNHGGASGTYGNGGPAGLTDQDGKGIDPETMKQVETLGRAGDTAGLQKLFAAKGYRMSGPACGIVAGKYVMSAGFKPPPGGAIASNWNDWGERQNKSDINNPNRPFGSMVASYTVRRYGGNVGAPLGKGQTGGHVMTIVPGSYDAKTNTAMFADQYGVRRRTVSNMDIRYAGDSAVAEVRAKRSGGSARVDGVGVGGAANDNTVYRGGVAGALAEPDQAPIAGVNKKGVTQNNPLNLKFSGSKWQMENLPGIRRGTTTDQGDPQAAFNSPQAGWNAAAVLVLRKQARGMTTVREIIAGQGGWTPGHQQAVSNVAGIMGVSPDAKLNLSDPKVLASFMDALQVQEQGRRYYPKEMIEKAARKAIDAVTGKTATPQPAATPPQSTAAPQSTANTADRAALSADKAADVKTDGKLTSVVRAPPGTKVEVSGSGAFKNTSTTRETTMSRETANELLTVR